MLTLKNEGALATKIFVKTRDGQSVPFVSQDELNKKLEEQALKEAQQKAEAEEQDQVNEDEDAGA